jgi:hypothetical protein
LTKRDRSPDTAGASTVIYRRGAEAVIPRPNRERPRSRGGATSGASLDPADANAWMRHASSPAAFDNFDNLSAGQPTFGSNRPFRPTVASPVCLGNTSTGDASEMGWRDPLLHQETVTQIGFHCVESSACGRRSAITAADPATGHPSRSSMTILFSTCGTDCPREPGQPKDK